MHDGIRDQIQTAFAYLTGLMEDAAAKAAAGQNPAIKAAQAAELVRDIEVLLNRAGNRLGGILALAGGRALQNAPEVARSPLRCGGRRDGAVRPPGKDNRASEAVRLSWRPWRYSYN